MIKPLALIKLQQRFGGECFAAEGVEITQLTTDSRKVVAGVTFVALAGENFDAHDFIGDVIASGASAVVVDSAWAKLQPQLPAGVAVWVVDDCLLALSHIAIANRENYSHSLVAITGSCGKTTVKEMLTCIATKQLGPESVLATRGNLNNHIGVPLTLFELTKNHNFAIIEMGASGPDEIAYLARIAKPQVALVNNVMAAHVEGFGSLAGVAKAKSAIYDELASDGIAIINLDDDFAADFVRQNRDRKQLTFSVKRKSADFHLADLKLSAQHSEFTVIFGEQSATVSLPLAGQHNVGNALAAVACAVAAGIDLNQACAALAQFVPVAGRMNIIAVGAELTVIDDTYNANPGSVLAAIKALAQFNGSRYLVLGDMGELGEESQHLHAQVGRQAKQAGLDMLVCVGDLSLHAQQAFGDGAKHFSNQNLASEFLQEAIKSQVGHLTLLVKGSRSARMENIVQAITNIKRNG